MAAIVPEADQSHGGSAVIAITYIFIIITLLFTAVRITLTYLRKRTFGLDDVLLILAVPLGLLSAICAGNSVVNGLGRSIAYIHSGQLENYFKLSYASQIFMILSLAASKHSFLALIDRITPGDSPFKRYVRWFHLFIISWTIFSGFGIAFECSIQAPWLYQPARCAGSGDIWYAVSTASMVTDIVLAFGFVPAIRNISIESKRKKQVTGLFLARLIVPVFAIAHIALLSPALKVDDQTRAMPTPTILAQVMMNLSILTAALPAISRSLTALEPASPATVVNDITAINLDSTHNRTTSDENNRLRDWAFAQLRNSPTPNSLIKDTSTLEKHETPRKPEKAQLALERVDTAPAIPPRSDKRSASPRLTLNFSDTSPGLDVKEAWFVDSNRSSTLTESTLDGAKRVSTRTDVVF